MLATNAPPPPTLPHTRECVPTRNLAGQRGRGGATQRRHAAQLVHSHGALKTRRGVDGKSEYEGVMSVYMRILVRAGVKRLGRCTWVSGGPAPSSSLLTAGSAACHPSACCCSATSSSSMPSHAGAGQGHLHAGRQAATEADAATHIASCRLTSRPPSSCERSNCTRFRPTGWFPQSSQP